MIETKTKKKKKRKEKAIKYFYILYFIITVIFKIY